jgi:GNAT superfamily N-acetyltransferase
MIGTPMTAELRIEPADPRGAAALALLREAAVEVRALYPELHAQAHPSLWPANPPVPARGAYFLGWLEKVVVASGALRPIDEHTAELRRMFVHPDYRRKGFARAMLERLEGEARALGYALIRLETGYKQEAAMTLYQACGWRPIAPFGEYASDPTSRCFGKGLT